MKKFFKELKGNIDMITFGICMGSIFYAIIVYDRNEINSIVLIILALINMVLNIINCQMEQKKRKTYSLSFTHGTHCALSEAEPGFFLFGDTLCYKNEYDESFIISSGEMFWGGANTQDSRDALMIVPLNETKK